MALIKVIQPEEAEGELKEVYDDIITTRGKLAEIHKIQSLNPKSIVNHMDLYMTLMYGKSPIKRVVREMMAVVVSKANNCK
jgi:alkylhydroperoxidase family enzyme